MQPPFWDSQWQALCDKWDREGYESLTPDEKTWLNIRSLIDSTNNGGLVSYFYNSGADTLNDCLEALTALEAEDVRGLVERLASLFPGNVPTSIDERNAIISSWDGDSRIEGMLEQIDDELFPKLDAVEEKLESFIRRSRLAI